MKIRRNLESGSKKYLSEQNKNETGPKKRIVRKEDTDDEDQFYSL